MLLHGPRTGRKMYVGVGGVHRRGGSVQGMARYSILTIIYLNFCEAPVHLCLWAEAQTRFTYNPLD